MSAGEAMPLFRKCLFVALCVSAVCAEGAAQADPTTQEPYGQFSLPDVGGTLRYALTASETVLTGYNGTTGTGAHTYTNFSGDVAYLSRSERHPFSAVYAGGYLVGGSTFPSYFYQSLSLSQGYQTKNWSFLIGDSVSYLPQTPIGSLSGVPGAGDLGLASVQVTNSPSLDILTTYGTRIGNTVSGTATRKFTASTSLAFTGSDAIERFTSASAGSQGIDNDEQTAGATLEHRLNERTSVGAGYQFSNSTFSSSLIGPGSYGFQAHSAQGFFRRELTPHINLSLGAGPQWVLTGSNGGVTAGTSVSVAANAELSYEARRFNSSISYARGVNNGNGVVVGSRLDSIVANVARPFGRIYNVGGLVGYNHAQQLSTTLLPSFNSNGVVAGGQFSAHVHPSVMVFTSYTLQRQLFTGSPLAGIAFNGLTQYVSFGVTYSPKPFFHRR